jgi:hypothetical protein
MSLVKTPGSRPWLLGLCLFAGLAGGANVLHAQRDDVIVDSPVAVETNHFGARHAAALELIRLRGLVKGGGVQVSPETIEQWIFGGARGVFSKLMLETPLKEKVEAYAFLCGANEEQKAKLYWAGQIDIRRFLDRVDQLKRKAEGTTENVDRINEVHQQAQRLNQLKADLFHAESFFAKTVRTVFTSEQLAAADGRRAAHQHQAHAERVAALLKDALKLTDQQEQALVALMLTQTRPPRQPGVHAFQVAMFDLKRLPESKLRAILNDQQWDLFNQQFELVKWMEPQLRRNGLLYDVEPAPPKPMK